LLNKVPMTSAPLFIPIIKPDMPAIGLATEEEIVWLSSKTLLNVFTDIRNSLKI